MVKKKRVTDTNLPTHTKLLSEIPNDQHEESLENQKLNTESERTAKEKQVTNTEDTIRKDESETPRRRGAQKRPEGLFYGPLEEKFYCKTEFKKVTGFTDSSFKQLRLKYPSLTKTVFGKVFVDGVVFIQLLKSHFLQTAADGAPEKK